MLKPHCGSPSVHIGFVRPESCWSWPGQLERISRVPSLGGFQGVASFVAEIVQKVVIFWIDVSRATWSRARSLWSLSLETMGDGVSRPLCKNYCWSNNFEACARALFAVTFRLKPDSLVRNRCMLPSKAWQNTEHSTQEMQRNSLNCCPNLLHCFWKVASAAGPDGSFLPRLMQHLRKMASSSDKRNGARAFILT